VGTTFRLLPGTVAPDAERSSTGHDARAGDDHEVVRRRARCEPPDDGQVPQPGP